MGHAVYTKSDPRAVILRRNAEHLAVEKGFEDEFRVLCAVERLGPDAVREVKGTKDVCANVDLFSGLIYRMLGISEDLFTPLFAISRIPGCARTAWRRSCLQTASCARLTNIWGMSRNIYR